MLRMQGFGKGKGKRREPRFYMKNEEEEKLKKENEEDACGKRIKARVASFERRRGFGFARCHKKEGKWVPMTERETGVDWAAEGYRVLSVFVHVSEIRAGSREVKVGDLIEVFDVNEIARSL